MDCYCTMCVAFCVLVSLSRIDKSCNRSNTTATHNSTHKVKALQTHGLSGLANYSWSRLLTGSPHLSTSTTPLLPTLFTLIRLLSICYFHLPFQHSPTLPLPMCYAKEREKRMFASSTRLWHPIAHPHLPPMLELDWTIWDAVWRQKTEGRIS